MHDMQSDYLMVVGLEQCLESWCWGFKKLGSLRQNSMISIQVSTFL